VLIIYLFERLYSYHHIYLSNRANQDRYNCSFEISQAVNRSVWECLCVCES